MTTESHPVTSTASFLLFLAIFTSGIIALLLAGDLNPWVSIPVALAPPLLVLAVRKFPAALVVPIIFISNFKSQATTTQGLSLTDPTLLCLALLLVALCLNLFFLYVQARGETLRYLFAGQGKAIACFLLLELIVAFSYLYTSDPEYGKTLVSKFLTIDLLLFLVPLLLFRDERDLRHFALAMVAFAVPLTLYRAFVNFSTASGVNVDVTQISAGHLIGMTILLIVNYRMTQSRWLQLGIFLTIPLLVVGLIVSDARGPALACLAMFFVSVFSKRGAGVVSGRAAKIAIIVMVLAMVGVTIAKVASSGSRGGEKLHAKAAELKALLSGESARGSAGDRLFGWEAAVSAFIKKPALGWGAGGSRAYIATHRGIFGLYGGDLKLEYPHNVFLQVAAEQGIVGLLLLLSFFWLAFKAAKQVANITRGRLSCFFWILIFDIMVIQVSGDLDGWRAVWLWCGITFATSRMLIVGAIPSRVTAAGQSPEQIRRPHRPRFRGVPQPTFSRY